MSGTNGNGQESTPPGGIDISQARNPQEALALLHAESDLTRAEVIRLRGTLAAHERSLRAHSDVVERLSASIAGVAAHVDLAEHASERAGETASLVRADLADLEGRVIAAIGAQANATRELRALIGEAPRRIDPRESKAGTHTPDELKEMESGTGLAGIVGRLSADHSRLVRRVALGASIAAALPPIAAEIIRACF